MNSVSIALFFWTIVYRWSNTPVADSVSAASFAQNATDFVADAAPQMVISTTGYWIWVVILVLYAFSIVYGRLYTAMHSFTDCAVGTALGVATWVLYLYYAEPLDTWLKNSGWIGLSQFASFWLPLWSDVFLSLQSPRSSCRSV